jgi:hypothetical protein
MLPERFLAARPIVRFMRIPRMVDAPYRPARSTVKMSGATPSRRAKFELLSRVDRKAFVDVWPSAAMYSCGVPVSTENVP